MIRFRTNTQQIGYIASCERNGLQVTIRLTKQDEFYRMDIEDRKRPMFVKNITEAVEQIKKMGYKGF